jgi:hypothetical protein
VLNAVCLCRSALYNVALSETSMVSGVVAPALELDDVEEGTVGKGAQGAGRARLTAFVPNAIEDRFSRAALILATRAAIIIVSMKVLKPQ